MDKKKKEKGNEKRRKEKKEKNGLNERRNKKQKEQQLTKKTLTNPFVHVSRVNLFQRFVGMWGKKASTTTIRLDK